MTIPTWTCLILSDLSEAKWGRAWIVEISVWHNRQEQSSSIKKQRIKNKGSNLNEGKCFNYSAYVYVKQSVHAETSLCYHCIKKLYLSKFWFYDEQDKAANWLKG
jgi:hypothetical protein